MNDHNNIIKALMQGYSDLCVKVQLVDIDSLVPGKGMMTMMTMTMKMTKMMLVTINMLHIPG